MRSGSCSRLAERDATKWLVRAGELDMSDILHPVRLVANDHLTLDDAARRLLLDRASGTKIEEKWCGRRELNPHGSFPLRIFGLRCPRPWSPSARRRFVVWTIPSPWRTLCRRGAPPPDTKHREYLGRCRRQQGRRLTPDHILRGPPWAPLPREELENDRAQRPCWRR